MSRSKLLSNSLRVFVSFVGGQIGFLCYYLPNKVYIDKVQRITQSYKEKNPIPVSEKVRLLFDEVMNDMKLPEEDKKKIQLYTSWRLDFFYAGSIWTSGILDDFQKAIIGVPRYFNWKNLSEEIKEKIVFQGEKLDWSSEYSKKLENSLFISDKAKKFGLAQNLFYVSSFEPLYNGGITTAFMLMAIQYIYICLNLKRLQDKRFKSVRYFAAFTSVLFNITVWLLFKDMYRCHLETKADEAVANLGKEYIEGGVEYYNSILEKNIALRNMTTSTGMWATFSHFGNEKMTFRQRHIPLTGRRDYFQKLLNE